jgi:hypothetical protein
MLIIRDIFYLKFGQYRTAKALLDEAVSLNMFPNTSGFRILTDFTGDSYRLIMEQTAHNLAEYEGYLNEEMGKNEWRGWYDKFIPTVNSSHREILRQVM